jgi:hypothetical protein
MTIPAVPSKASRTDSWHGEPMNSASTNGDASGMLLIDDDD